MHLLLEENKTKQWLVIDSMKKKQKKHIHIMYLPKQNSAFGFCFADASLTYNQVKSNLNKQK